MYTTESTCNNNSLYCYWDSSTISKSCSLLSTEYTCESNWCTRSSIVDEQLGTCQSQTSVCGWWCSASSLDTRWWWVIHYVQWSLRWNHKVELIGQPSIGTKVYASLYSQT